MKRRAEDAVTIFVTAPVEELERRLRERATESSGVIEERIDDGAPAADEPRRSSITWSRTTTGSVQQSASRRSSPESSTGAATMAAQ